MKLKSFENMAWCFAEKQNKVSRKQLLNQDKQRVRGWPPSPSRYIGQSLQRSSEGEEELEKMKIENKNSFLQFPNRIENHVLLMVFILTRFWVISPTNQSKKMINTEIYRGSSQWRLRSFCSSERVQVFSLLRRHLSSNGTIIQYKPPLA